MTNLYVSHRYSCVIVNIYKKDALMLVERHRRTIYYNKPELLLTTTDNDVHLNSSVHFILQQ